MVLSLTVVNTLFLFPVWILAPYDVLILNTGFCVLSTVLITTAHFQKSLSSALWESRHDMNHAQTVGQIGSWRLNVQRNELYWSDENHRIFGIPKGTPMAYETFLSTVHPDDREFVDQKFQAGLRGEPYDIEHRLIVAGEVKWVRDKAELEFDKNGQLLGGFGTTQDITDRKRNELALQESQQRYAAIVESAMDAVITIDENQHILLFNAAAEKMFDCKANDVIGGSIERFIPESNRATHGAHVRAFGLTGITSRKMGKLGAISGLRATGEEFPVEASISQAEMNGEKLFTVILRDVTERVLTDIALHERLSLQDQLTKVATTVPGVICSFRLRPDGSTSMPYASPVFESIYGFSGDSVVNDFSPVFDRIHTDDIAHVQDTITESACTLQPWRDTFRYQHPNKGEIWLEGHSMPLREVDGSTLWHGYIQDVTERKQTEEELQQRIARYELVLDGVQDGIWDWDVPNKRVHFSSRWKALRGFAEDEVGNDEAEWSANIHPDDSARVFAAVEAHFEGKTSVFYEEYRVRCKDGSWKWILDRGISQRDASGQVIRMAGSETDITERKRAETDLREHENELRLIMDATPALISYLDTDFRYLRVNATYQEWFCIPRELIIGHDAREIIGEKAWNIVRPYVERTRAGEQVSFDQVIPYGTGKPRWVHASYIPHKDANGTVKGIVVHIVDIEDRKLAEQKIALLNIRLKQRLEEMQVIFNTAPIGLAIADDNSGRNIRGNRANERMLGLEPYAELSMRNEKPPNFMTMQNGCPLEVDQLPMQRAVCGEVITNQILEIVRPDGQVLTVLSNASPLFDADGTPRGAVGAFLDITALMQAEESLRKSQTQLRLFIEQAPVSIAMFDRDMNYLVTSHRWIEDFGRGYTDLIGRNHYEVIPDLPEEWKQIYSKAQTGEFLKNDNDLWVHTDSSRQWLRWVAYPWTDQTGEIGGIILSCEDITAHRLAEEGLRTTQARLALVVEEVHAGYWDWDLVIHKLFLSPEWKRQIGYEEHELPDQWEEWGARLHPDDRDVVFTAIEDYIVGRQADYELQFRLRHKNGSYRWIHSRGSLLRDQNNRPYRMLGINLDITDFMKSKELSERRDKMEQSFRSYVAVQTAAAIAHELNQPLAAIASYADVALHLLQSGNPNPQKLTHVLENCSQQAQRAGEVIRQLLTLLHKGEFVGEPMDINHSVREAFDFIKADWLFDAFNIELDLAADLPPVKANVLQIQKVLVNLLRNGLESMQESGLKTGTITVSTRITADDPPMAQVTVCDSGKGVVDAATLKTMFQPFYTTKPAGLGMGLAISHSLIKAHGGNMWAQQNAGNGISIHFTLPFVI